MALTKLEHFKDEPSCKWRAKELESETNGHGREQEEMVMRQRQEEQARMQAEDAQMIQQQQKQQQQQKPQQQQQQQPQQQQLINGLTEEQLDRHAMRQEQLGLASEEVINEIQASSGARVEAMLERSAGEGPEGFYPKPLEDYDYPWAGSLKPVSNELFKREYQQRTQDPGPCPWAGSLRAVGEGRKHRKKKDQDEEDGVSPWAGSLHHVSGPIGKSLAFTKQPLVQFKRYPDEDAPNPFVGLQRKAARAHQPLTPASLINGCTVDYESMKSKEEEEQMGRIRGNIRKTVSGTLLKALMPKLLKEHQAKYAPLSEEESMRIMEEILSMKIGIPHDANLDDNEEAEQMIRAITHGEIDNTVFSQMADDLENAAQMKKNIMNKAALRKKKAEPKTSKELKA